MAKILGKYRQEDDVLGYVIDAVSFSKKRCLGG